MQILTPNCTDPILCFVIAELDFRKSTSDLSNVLDLADSCTKAVPLENPLYICMKNISDAVKTGDADTVKEEVSVLSDSSFCFCILGTYLTYFSHGCDTRMHWTGECMHPRTTTNKPGMNTEGCVTTSFGVQIKRLIIVHGTGQYRSRFSTKLTMWENVISL